MRKLAAVGLALMALGACAGDSAAPPTMPTGTPTADPRVTVAPGVATGPTAITFVSADPGPGAVLSGCGPDAGGCRGRLRMIFRLTPSGTGPVLGIRVFLHATSKRACLLASGGPLSLRAGEAAMLEAVFDDSDACATPVDIATMAAVVEGTVEVASRQEWAIHYTLAP